MKTFHKLITWIGELLILPLFIIGVYFLLCALAG